MIYACGNGAGRCPAPAGASSSVAGYPQHEPAPSRPWGASTRKGQPATSGYYVKVAMIVCLTRSLSGLDGMSCVVLWMSETLDCRVRIPPEAWSGLTRNPPSLGFEPQTLSYYDISLSLSLSPSLSRVYIYICIYIYI